MAAVGGTILRRPGREYLAVAPLLSTEGRAPPRGARRGKAYPARGWRTGGLHGKYPRGYTVHGTGAPPPDAKGGFHPLPRLLQRQPPILQLCRSQSKEVPVNGGRAPRQTGYRPRNRVHPAATAPTKAGRGR